MKEKLNKMKLDKIVPDTSIIIEGLLSDAISKNVIITKKIIFHEAVLAELESQANKNKETGYIGLEEIEKIRILSKNKKFFVEFKGSRPGDFEIKFAKAGEIDSLIRELANSEKATLVTADIVQSKVAKAKGISVYLYDFKKTPQKKLLIEKFFLKDVCLIVIKEGSPIRLKKKTEGFKSSFLSKKIISKEEVQEYIKDIYEIAKTSEDSFFEVEKKGSSIINIGSFKIVVIRPPLSHVYQICVEKLSSTNNINSFGVNTKIKKILFDSNKILITSLPFEGGENFCSIVTNYLFYSGVDIRYVGGFNNLLCKDIVQYLPNQSSNGDLLDIILANKPQALVFGDNRFFLDTALYGIKNISFNFGDFFDVLSKLSKKVGFDMLLKLIDVIIVVEKNKIKNIFSLRAKVSEKFEIEVYDLLNNKKVFSMVQNGEGFVVNFVKK